MIDDQALRDAIEARHSVRSFIDRPLAPEAVEALRAEVDAANRESGLHLQLMTDEPDAFNFFIARYGSFKNVRNYLACVGEKGSDLNERVGYWGQRIVLVAQALGLNSCWVGLSFSRRKSPAVVGPGEKMACAIALGYGETPGVPHKVKTAAEVSRAEQPVPRWFQEGVRGAILAPTAINQQKFLLTLEGDRVRAKATGGPYSDMDLGIVKRNFEIASGRDHAVWL